MTGRAASAGSATGDRLERVTALVDVDAWCMGPVTRSLQPDALVTRDRNRWSEDEPTIYLAGDPGVAISEFGRHWSEESDPAWMWAMRLRLDHAIDLRKRETQTALGIPAESSWILDRDRCRSIARELRATGRCDGLIVPSVAFLDDEARWNAVIFVERLAWPLASALEVVSRSHVLTSTVDRQR